MLGEGALGVIFEDKGVVAAAGEVEFGHQRRADFTGLAVRDERDFFVRPHAQTRLYRIVGSLNQLRIERDLVQVCHARMRLSGIGGGGNVSSRVTPISVS